MDRYCKFCEPHKELIDDDSIKADGYIIKGKRKIYLCELCLDGQKRFYEVHYFDESKNIKKENNSCHHDISNYRKKNLVTLDGGYDIMECTICGHEFKRFGFGN